MASSSDSLHDAILERDAKRISELILAAEFVLLNTVVGEDEDDSNVGAMTAEIEDMEVLVVFSEENSAGEFVRENGDLFEEDEEVEGVVVEGAALLDYLPDDYGILLDPKGEEALVLDASLIAEIKSAGD